MRFEKGKSGNPAGRPKGSSNKVTNDLRSRISIFLNEEFDTVKRAFKKLNAEKKLRFYSDLLVYSVPKLSATTLDVSFDQLTDEQLTMIIEELKKTASEQKGKN